MLKWPDGKTVRRAVERWALQIRRKHPTVRIGYFGSYARGDWGVGSDLDLLIIVDRSELPRERRALPFDKEHLPVPADLLVYTRAEWESLSASGSRFVHMIRREAVWL